MTRCQIAQRIERHTLANNRKPPMSIKYIFRLPIAQPQRQPEKQKTSKHVRFVEIRFTHFQAASHSRNRQPEK